MNEADRAAITAIVGETLAPGILADLEELLGGYAKACRERAAVPRYKSAPPAEMSDTAGRIARASAELRAALAGASEMLEERIRASIHDEGRRYAWDCLPELLPKVETIAAHVESTFGRIKAKRGPKADPYREALRAAVAAILAKHGIAPSAHAQGPFARVLAVVWRAATGERLPVAIRQTLTPTVKRLRRA